MLSAPFVDYIQFSISHNKGVYQSFISEGYSPLAVLDAVLQDALPSYFLDFLYTLELKNGFGARPYNSSLSGDGVTIMFNSKSDKLGSTLVQISGKGCAKLQEAGLIYDLLRDVKPAVSRIDIAADFVGKLDPEKAFTTSKRVSILDSDTGKTVYVGAYGGMRYARIYRYNPPHPRCDSTRYELVFRKFQAKRWVDMILDRGIEKAFADALVTQRITLPDGMVKEAGEYVPENRLAPEPNTTVLWLINVCAKSFRKMVSIGAIDNPRDFIERYFLKGIE